MPTLQNNENVDISYQLDMVFNIFPSNSSSKTTLT